MNGSDAFVKRVEAELREIGRRESKLAEQEDVIKRQRVELRSRLAELNKTLAVYRQVMGVDVGGPGIVEEASVPVALGTIVEMAYALLRQRGGPMKIADIVAELQRLGKLKGGGTTGRGDYGTVYRTLNRDRRFLRSGKAEFTLAVASEPERPAEQSPAAPRG